MRRHQAITWADAGILLIRTLGTNVSATKMHLKISSAKWQPFCLDLNVLKKDVAVIVRVCHHPIAIPMYQQNYHRFVPNDVTSYKYSLSNPMWFGIKFAWPQFSFLRPACHANFKVKNNIRHTIQYIRIYRFGKSLFCTRHFQMHFLEWKYANFNSDLIEICSQGSN